MDSITLIQLLRKELAERSIPRKGSSSLNNTRIAPRSLVGYVNEKTISSSKLLIVEARDHGFKQYPWDDEAKHRFLLSDAEVDELEHNAVVWRESTAFMLEKPS